MCERNLGHFQESFLTGTAAAALDAFDQQSIAFQPDEYILDDVGTLAPSFSKPTLPLQWEQ
jgi:hypothetical protein